MKDFIEVISTFFSEYFSYSINALTNETIYFQPTQITTNDIRRDSIEPKIIIFSIFNILIGLCIFNAIENVDFSSMPPKIALSIILWIFWASLSFLICKIFNLKSLGFLQFIALSIQLYGIIYLLASFFTLLLKIFSNIHNGRQILLSFFTFQFLLLIFFTSRSYIKYQSHRFIIQPIFAAIIGTSLYIFINMQLSFNSIYSKDEMTAGSGSPNENATDYNNPPAGIQAPKDTTTVYKSIPAGSNCHKDNNN